MTLLILMTLFDICSSNEIKNVRQNFQSNKIVVFSGSLQDLNIIINSVQSVIKQIPDVNFVIIGDHRDLTRSKLEWQKKVQDKNIDKNFIFLGRLHKEEIPKYLLSANVCVDSFPNEPY